MTLSWWLDRKFTMISNICIKCSKGLVQNCDQVIITYEFKTCIVSERKLANFKNYTSMWNLFMSNCISDLSIDAMDVSGEQQVLCELIWKLY